MIAGLPLPSAAGAPAPQRLDKTLRERLALSVRQVEQLWASGQVELGRPTPFGLAELVYREDVVRVGGAPLGPPPPRVHFALHKPAGVTTTTRDPGGARDLQSWLGSLAPGVFPVGRLDRDTTGLLLLTNDGDLSYALLSPRHAVEKEYAALVRWSIGQDDPRLARLRAGVLLDGVQAHVVCARVVDPPSRRLSVVLTEGRHRQVRRMCKGVGLALSGLARVRIGPLELGSLATGEVRPLAPEEVERLFEVVGGRSALGARQLRALVDLAARRRGAGCPDARLEAWLADRGGRDACAPPRDAS